MSLLVQKLSFQFGNWKYQISPPFFFFFNLNAMKKKNCCENLVWKQLKRGKEKNPLPICENSMVVGFTMKSSFNEKLQKATRIACGSSRYI